jgi:hypothetical protein
VTVAQLTRPVLGPEVLAKHDGPCPFCPEPIVAGESYIRKVRDRVYMHGPCAAAYDRVIAANLPDEDDESA